MSKLSHIEIIRRIAKQTDLSTSSVYKILHNPFDFSLDTSKRVLQLAEEYGYSENKPAMNKTCKISITIPSRPSYYWREAMAGMKAAQREIKKQEGKQLELTYHYIQLRRGDMTAAHAYTESLQDDSDGYIIFPVPIEECSQLICQKGCDYPVILFNECHSELLFKQFPEVYDLNNMNIASVGLDNIEAGRSAYRLIENRLDEIDHFVFITTKGDQRDTPMSSVLRMESCRHELLLAKPDFASD